MGRFESAVEARETLAEDFFGGWQPSDADLLNRYYMPAEPSEGKITDFFGIKTDSSFHAWAAHLHNQIVNVIPIPDDSLRAETIEYYATLNSFEMAPEGTFSMAEIGASYGPWTCFAATLAKRYNRIARLVAVEASSFLYALIPQHLMENGINPNEGNISLIKGAVASEHGNLHFPIVTSAAENGGQIIDQPGESDYLGRKVEYEAVQAFPLAEVLPTGMVDLVHIDVQGVEFDVLSSAIHSLNARVRVIFIGTHSRLIEGQLIELFHKNGWELERERPTKFVYTHGRPDVVGWTTRDGGQYWINRNLVPA